MGETLIELYGIFRNIILSEPVQVNSYLLLSLPQTVTAFVIQNSSQTVQHQFHAASVQARFTKFDVSQFRFQNISDGSNFSASLGSVTCPVLV